MTPLEFFRQHASEFNNLPDDRAQNWLNSAVLFVFPSGIPAAPADKDNLKLALYGAHLCWMDKYQRGGHRGKLVMEQEGESRRQYSGISVKGTDDILGQSPYGQQYKQLVFGLVQLPGIITRYGTDGNAC